MTVSFVRDLLKQKRELGTIAPKVRTEQTPAKLNAEQLDVLRQLVEAQPDATLAEFRERLHQQYSGQFLGRKLKPSFYRWHLPH